MTLMNEIPDRFWSLFRSVNRPVYIEALLKISEEYEYSNYFLSREVCIQLLAEHFSGKQWVIWQEDSEEEADTLEPPATRILNWLLRAGWLKQVDDYSSMTVNIVIPDYAEVMIEAFLQLSGEEENEAQVYIQNVYAILFSLKNDPKAGVGLLNTALVNTKKLNKSLQKMLHNMDKFFTSLLNQESVSGLLRDHLEGYVEEIVNKKYHILKTSDNFYLYKADIMSCIASMREDEEWFSRLSGDRDGVMEKLDQLERGFFDIERRLANMDKEHIRYVRGTVTRLGYLLNREDNTKGLVIQLLNHLSSSENREEDIERVAQKMNLSHTSILSEKSLYKRRKTKADFADQLDDEEEEKELTPEEILELNRVKNRYSREEILDFVDSRMKDGRMEVDETTVTSDEEFEKLILAYDYSTRRKSAFAAQETKEEPVVNGAYTYPGLVFTRRKNNAAGE